MTGQLGLGISDLAVNFGETGIIQADLSLQGANLRLQSSDGVGQGVGLSRQRVGLSLRLTGCRLQAADLVVVLVRVSGPRDR